MTEEETLAAIRARRLFLTMKGTLWAPNTYVPLPIRRAIREHQANLRARIQAGDLLVCCSLDLHRQYACYIGDGRYVCDACAGLLKEVS